MANLTDFAVYICMKFASCMRIITYHVVCCCVLLEEYVISIAYKGILLIQAGGAKFAH